MFCINCGTNIPEGSKFCTKCGATLGVAKTATTTSNVGVSGFARILRIIILIALALLALYIIYWDWTTDRNLISNEGWALNVYGYILETIISIVAQLGLIFVLMKRWHIVLK